MFSEGIERKQLHEIGFLKDNNKDRHVEGEATSAKVNVFKILNRWKDYIINKFLLREILIIKARCSCHS